MYLLIRIGTNDIRTSELISKSKKKLENHIKEKGFYWSKNVIDILMIKIAELVAEAELTT